MDRIGVLTDECVRLLQRHAELSWSQVKAMGDGDELGQRRGRAEMAELLKRATELSNRVVELRDGNG